MTLAHLPAEPTARMIFLNALIYHRDEIRRWLALAKEPVPASVKQARRFRAQCAAAECRDFWKRAK